ncbi:MAG: tRNA pseudouridine(55) synthase TruB [Clostridiales bacterium]|jgi:tRNA pseudouridine55 synthase|nr:tRNA pseudouridine(55) synthase TruB [Clostridiales bacterium]
MKGAVNIYKEKGFTSHDVVNIVRGLTKCKAGHTGTLDPDAEGVLPVCIGRATKIADYIMADDKEYIADVILGASTDTQDASGEILERKPFLGSLSDIHDAVRGFIGEITQMPPMYSAVKIGGKKLYEYARQGATVERKPRRVTIRDIEVLEANLPGSFKIRVGCSKGTYIRALCADIGAALGVAAHMGDLLRTKSGGFNIENAVKLADFREIVARDEIERVLIPIETALEHFPKISISAEADKWLKNGNKIPLDFVRAEIALSQGAEYLAYDAAGGLAGIFALSDAGHIKPKVMLN